MDGAGQQATLYCGGGCTQFMTQSWHTYEDVFLKRLEIYRWITEDTVEEYQSPTNYKLIMNYAKFVQTPNTV